MKRASEEPGRPRLGGRGAVRCGAPGRAEGAAVGARQSGEAPGEVRRSASWDVEVGGRRRLGLEDGDLPGSEVELPADPQLPR